MLGKLNHEEIETLLKNQAVGRIGCHADGITYVVPVTYVYDGNYIICHSASGMKTKMMRANNQVCFEVDKIVSMSNWQSVIAWGNYEELQGEEATRALQYLVSRLIPVEMSESLPHPQPMAGKGEHIFATVFRIKLEEKTGRFERR